MVYDTRDILVMADILPDCRLQRGGGTISCGANGLWVPVFCANCGADGGMVPLEGMTFLFYLCNLCAEKHGQIAGTMVMPDEVFYEKLKQEQLDRYGRYLTNEEWNQISEDPSHPLWLLIREQPTT